MQPLPLSLFLGESFSVGAEVDLGFRLYLGDFWLSLLCRERGQKELDNMSK